MLERSTVVTTADLAALQNVAPLAASAHSLRVFCNALRHGYPDQRASVLWRRGGGTGTVERRQGDEIFHPPPGVFPIGA